MLLVLPQVQLLKELVGLEAHGLRVLLSFLQFLLQTVGFAFLKLLQPLIHFLAAAVPQLLPRQRPVQHLAELTGAACLPLITQYRSVFLQHLRV